MKKLLLTAAIGSLMAGSAMAASPVSYSYAELGYDRTTENDVLTSGCMSGPSWCNGSQDSKGYTTGGSFEVIPHLFVRGNYLKVKDSGRYNGGAESQNSTWSEFSFGVGYSMNVGTASSAYAALDHLHDDWSVHSHGSSDNARGNQGINAITLGSRSKITDALEFDASVSAGSSEYQKAELALVNHIDGNISVKAAYSVESLRMNRVYDDSSGFPLTNVGANDFDLTSFSLSARYNF